ncbi:hypothetical protein CEXT_85361 [Caerostris extrusa]|uniref:Uncharacterized protein n=1 Tax=Caerostris extrusa TaxID=172846 RepID=A0AAV4PDB8_CAEEX|nr:hypothetical protein CEXT_85361 [Caerostris extrusa]
MGGKFFFNGSQVMLGFLWMKRIPLDLPRRIGIDCFHMLTGHNYLQQYLNKIGVTTSASCRLCEEDSIKDDILFVPN